MVLLLWMACGPGSEGLVFVHEPVVTPNASGAGLVVWLDVVTSEATTLEIEIEDQIGPSRHLHPGARDAHHHVLVGGLRPDHAHTLRVTARSPQGDVATHTLDYLSPPLPEDLPSLEVRHSKPERMEPGLTLAHLDTYLTMLDDEGTVRWYLPVGDDPVYTFGATPTGTLFYQSSRQLLTEIDRSGAVLGQWCAAGAPTPLPDCPIPVDVPAFHHDTLALDGGDWLTLSVEQALVEDYPTSELDRDAPRMDAWVSADVVVRFDRAGRVVQRWPLLDVLDPTRIGHDGVDGGFWSSYFGTPLHDWSHANALGFDAHRSEVLVSVRHQDAVIALDATSGAALRWIVAPDANWRGPWSDALLQAASPELRPPYHPHGATVTPTGSVVLFDNGTPGASAYETPLPHSDLRSRALEVELDLEAGTWDQVWSHEPDPSILALTVGGVQPLPTTGNRLVTFGNVRRPAGVGAIVQEVTAATPPEVVFEIRTLEGVHITKVFRVPEPWSNEGD